MGILYANGRGVRQDFTKAEEWYLKSANQNYTLAQRNLADLYLDGRGSVPSNSQKAVKYLKLAADKGDADCQYNLGVVYVEGTRTAKNDALGFKYFTAAAKQEQPNAQFNLAYMYAHGMSVQPSRELANYWFRKAAQNGHPDAYSMIR